MCARTVYSTDASQLCPGCRRARGLCQCQKPGDETLPDRITAKLRIEKSGRKGKTVTVVGGLPNNGEFLKTLAKELKAACGSGGTAVEGAVEIQGDHRDKIRERLTKKGFTVKG